MCKIWKKIKDSKFKNNLNHRLSQLAGKAKFWSVYDIDIGG